MVKVDQLFEKAFGATARNWTYAFFHYLTWERNYVLTIIYYVCWALSFYVWFNNIMPLLEAQGDYWHSIFGIIAFSSNSYVYQAVLQSEPGHLTRDSSDEQI